MQYLFNSHGQHIASFVNGQLHEPTGRNIGHFMESHGIFIDMRGRYLGEIVAENRLMCIGVIRRTVRSTTVITGIMGTSATMEIPGIMVRLEPWRASKISLERLSL